MKTLLFSFGAQVLWRLWRCAASCLFVSLTSRSSVPGAFATCRFTCFTDVRPEFHYERTELGFLGVSEPDTEQQLKGKVKAWAAQRAGSPASVSHLHISQKRLVFTVLVLFTFSQQPNHRTTSRKFQPGQLHTSRITSFWPLKGISYSVSLQC